jgi:hypothetical protein
MKLPKPILKLNGGNPIALCNRCFCVMCYISCDIQDLDINGDCVVIERNGNSDGDYITTPIGKTPPPYCDKCRDLLLKYSLNE